MEINCKQPEIKTAVDKDKFEKTVFNLMTNAFKYVNDEGFIKICQQATKGSLTPLLGAPNENQMLEISIFNSGSYIPTNAQAAIFERFFQLQSSKTQGTGIGLNMVKEYVMLHNGQIDVQSQKEEGTTFYIRFPREHSNEKAVFTNHNHLSSSATAAVPFTKAEVITSAPADKQALVMVVEDNADLRALLRKILNPYYSVVTAQNGRLALKKIEVLHPDLIISDVLMPEMNGFELCAKLKSSVETNHIPIILLTALNSEENQIEGYDKGADIYLPKPFSEPLLLTHAKNLITSRLKLKEKYLDPSTALSLSEEEVPGLSFLTKAETIVNEHLLNPSFTVETLAEKLNISRASLHRKLKNQTDQSATEFIRFVRLKAAIKLLKAGNSSLSEIAYNVGFSSPSYFSISFKKQFGKSPKEFMDDNH